MIKFPNLKCPICQKSYKDVTAFGTHMRAEHPGTIPEEWTDLRYAYYVHTGRDRGHCRECGGETPWNETTGSYAKICGSELCKKKFRDRVMAGMRARYGKVSLLDDPKYRERMLTGRKIAGEHTFADGGKVSYMGTLEKQFLIMLDKFFRFPSADIMSPSPNRYKYYYKNPNDPLHEGEHWYVPDFYIPSCNLEIELKAGSNQRPKNLMIDVVKDAYKDVAMLRNPMVSYIKIYETDYHVFFQVFADLARKQQTGDKTPIKYISRTLLASVYRDYIPDDLMPTLDKYIYQYSEKSVMKKPANEAELPIVEDEDTTEEDTQVETNLQIDEYYENDRTDDLQSVEDLDTDSEVGVNPMMYYQMGPYSLPDAALAEEAFKELFFIDEMSGAMESQKDQISTDSIYGRAALKHKTWKEKLFGFGRISQALTSTFSSVKFEDDRIVIKGINCNLLLYRIKDFYSEAKLKYIFEYRYNDKSWKLYQKKKIGKGDMKIDYVYAPAFFAIELIELFSQLADRYNDHAYRAIANQIYEKSWMKQADNVQVAPLSTEPLENLRLTLLPHQLAFIEKWPELKHQLNLNGYILAFKPGKGKTLTSVGLAECLKAKKIYIVCPNNLKDNWALELKKYYPQYDDDKKWLEDVCILGTKYGNPETARWIITNNENIKLMLPIAKRDPNAVLILDECHNFRNYKGTRSSELFELADKIGSKNVLCVSATPIKAVPAEIAPALRLIDPTFNDEAAAMYVRCFDLNDVLAMSVVNKRFGKLIYRPADAEVSLPEKTIENIDFSLPGEQRYYLDTVHAEVIQEYNKRHEAWQKETADQLKQFGRLIYQYSKADRNTTNGYLSWVRSASSSMRGGMEFHELSVKEYESFIDTYIRSNPSCPSVIADQLQKTHNEFVTAAKRDMGKAVGMIIPPRRTEMFINLYDTNKEHFYEMIRNNIKKTVIFSTMVPVVKHIAKDLEDYGIGTVCIHGQTGDRLALINKFRNDSNCLVMVATSWCMGVGVTLTEASQMFFFGAPWRSTDYEQAWSRIWRIGQTDPVHIYNVALKSKRQNLSDRMNKILEWSGKMFSASIDAAALDGVSDEDVQANNIVSEASENYRQATTYQVLKQLQKTLDEYDYGLWYQGKIQNPKDPKIYDEYYRTASPGVFVKHHGGVCFDFAAFEDFYIKANSLASDLYYIEAWNASKKKPRFETHVFVLVRDGNYTHVYFEHSFEKVKGIWLVRDLSQAVSFIINHMTEKWDKTGLDFRCYSLRTRYGEYNETMDEFIKRARSGPLIPIKYDPKIKSLPEYQDQGDWVYSIESFNMNRDDMQYSQDLREDQIRDLTMVQTSYDMYTERPDDQYPIKSSLRKISSQLYYDQIFLHADVKNGPVTHLHRTSFDTTYEFRAEFSRYLDAVETYIVMVKLPMIGFDRPIMIPMVILPYAEGYIYPTYSFIPRKNGIFFTYDLNQIFSYAASALILMAAGENRAFNPEWFEVRKCKYLFWEDFGDFNYEDMMKRIEEQTEKVEGVTYKYVEMPHRMGVLNHGWFIDRF